MTGCKAKQNIRRVTSVLLVLVLLISCAVFSASAESGSCGKSLTWSFEAGTLILSGTGEMDDYTQYQRAPWYHLRASITKVVFPMGLTSVGRAAFYDCTALTAVQLPNSVRRVQEHAFYGCTNLHYLNLPSTLSFIGNAAFYACEQLQILQLPIGLQHIGNQAFYRCESIVAVQVPRYVANIGTQAFAYCTSLVRVQIDAPVQQVPEWAFFGCSALKEIALPSTVTQTETNAFKHCDELTRVYHSGRQTVVNAVKQDIVQDVPHFANAGLIGDGVMEDTSFSTQITEDAQGNITQQVDTKVTVQEDMTLVSEVISSGDKYQTEITVSFDANNGWNEVSQAIQQNLSQINNDYAAAGNAVGTVITVYTGSNVATDRTFLQQLAGRDVTLEVVNPAGNSWKTDCSLLQSNEITENVKIDHTLGQATEQTKQQLGSQNCYYVNFSESANLKTEILVPLPNVQTGTNAFLYQIEQDGSYTRLQAVMVDKDSTAHFYLANVDKDTQYVVGLNVPGESTDNVIIPDEMQDVFGAIQRLEKIEYVITGARTMGGFTLGMVLIIVLVILLLLAIVVGVVMFFLNKRKQQRVQAL